MAASITKVFQNHPELFDAEMKDLIRQNESPFKFAGLNIVETTKESKAINSIRGTIMVIAGSGMCTGGRVKHHLVNNITRPESTIMFVGYQAVGTLGRSIVDGAERVRILGQKYPVNWLSKLKKPPKRLFVVHGESESAQAFADYVQANTDWDVTVPAYQDEAILD
jgi:metallo-beta-lactamase family protein